MSHHNGPTLNQEYNRLLQAWEQAGYTSDPQCEECSQDLRGQPVYDIGTMWVCADCRDILIEDDLPCHPPDWHEDFHSDG